MLAALLFEDEIATDIIGGLSSLCYDRQRRAAATAEIVVEPDEVVQPPGFRQGSVTTGGSFAEYGVFFHNQTLAPFFNLLQLRNDAFRLRSPCAGIIVAFGTQGVTPHAAQLRMQALESPFAQRASSRAGPP